MALGLVGVLDVSVITDTLIGLLTASRDASPLWKVNGGTVDKFAITITGSMPETVRGDGDCQLSLYLYHVSQDAYQRNSPVRGRAVPIPDQPLSLDLYYVLTAFAKKDYVQEQQAMSVALRCFHDNPLVRINELISGSTVKEEFCLTMEIEPVDKLGFLWQAFSTPFRLSAVYKVSVVFITPDITQPAPAKKVIGLGISAEAAGKLIAPHGQVFGTSRTVTFLTPDSTVALPKSQTIDLSPAVVGPGERFILYGTELDQTTVAAIFLVLADDSELDVTGWISTDPNAPTTKSRITLDLPFTGPPPGVYRLRAGSTGYRTSATLFSIGAHVQVAANPPVLNAVAGVYTITGAGFVAGHTEVLLAGAAAAGLSVTPGVLTFGAPAGTAPGLYAVRIRVNGVESPPGWWANVL